MAAAEATQEEEPLEVTADADEDSAGSKIVTALIVLIIVIIWVAVFAVLIKLDVGGFGSDVLYPVLKDVPVVNKILPEPDTKTEEAGYYTNLAAANARIRELESRLAATTSSDSANADEIEQLKAENARLKKFEEAREIFAKRMQEFNDNVLYNPVKLDTEEYKQYYGGIVQDNAEKIYRSVVKTYLYDQEVADQADLYSKMDPANAAAVITEMTQVDLNLAAKILDSMQQSKRALIMDALDSNVVAQLVTKMSK